MLDRIASPVLPKLKLDVNKKNMKTIDIIRKIDLTGARLDITFTLL